jgi:hypothetical protein
MTPEQLKAFTDAIEALRADITASISAVNAKCDALAEDVKANKKSDTAGERDRGVDGTMAEKVAADSIGRELHALRDQVQHLQRSQPARQSQATLDQFADVQAKADVAYIANGSRAPAPMQSEALIDFAVRTHRGLQQHSPKWKGAELAVIARDSTTFAGVCDAIRADALQAGLNPVGLPDFKYREITETTRGGHRVTSFVGNGTIFKAMARPVKHVTSIGGDDRRPRSGGGKVYVTH